VKKLCLFLISIGIVFWLVGCKDRSSSTLSNTQSNTPTNPIVHLKIQLLPYFSYAPLYIAEQEGYYAEQGLEVEALKLQGGEAFIALVRGEIDVAATFVSSNSLSAVYQGENVKIVADKGYVVPEGCTVNGLLARKQLMDEGKLNSVQDMLGKKIKYDQTSIQAFYVQKLLETVGASLDDVEYVDFNSSAVLLQIFESGGVDLAIESEPWLTRNTDTGNAVLWKDMKDLIPNF